MQEDGFSGIKWGLGSWLILILVFTGVFILALINIPGSPICGVLAIPFVLMFPGYPLVIAVFPERKDIGGAERLVLSCICSVAVVVGAGLILDRTSWGIKLESLAYALSLFMILVSAIAFIRLQRRPGAFAFGGLLKFDISQLLKKTPGNILTGVLVTGILALLAVFGIVAAQPDGEEFTGFYLLGEQGALENYPRELIVGQEVYITIGIVNREMRDIDYYVEVLVGGVSAGTAGPLEVGSNMEIEQSISFRAPVPGNDQKAEFLLFNSSGGEPLKTLHYRVNVAALDQQISGTGE